MTENLKVQVAFHPAGLDACALYRMFLPHLRLPGSIFIYNVEGITMDRIAQAQVVVVQRLYSKKNLAALVAFKKKDMKVVYDLDDDMWSIPSYNPMCEALRKVIPGFNTCATVSDMITVSTEHLRIMVQKELGKRCPRIEVVENSMDFDWFKPLPEKYRRNKNGKVVIGWAGTPTHSEDVETVFSLIPEIIKDLPEVEIEIAAKELPAVWAPIASRVRLREYVPVAEWAVNWPSWQWDIALAPLAENKFNLSKSNIKALEAAALKIPCVLSNVAEYRKFCLYSPLLKKHCLAEYRNDWKEKIRALVLNPDLRKRIGEEMYRVAFEKYNVLNTVKKYEKLYASLV